MEESHGSITCETIVSWVVPGGNPRTITLLFQSLAMPVRGGGDVNDGEEPFFSSISTWSSMTTKDFARGASRINS